MIVYVDCQDQDNSCSDPDCCGGPYPSYAVRIFSSLEKAKEAGLTMREIDELIKVEIDNKEFQYVG